MSGKETVRREPEFVAFVGIDWADQKHVWCWQAADTGECESGELEHKPEAVEAWVGELCQRFGDGPIAVAVELVKGALVYMLRKYECLHLYPVPSTMSASMREALYPSGAKDDPRDADLLLELLVLHRDKLRRLTPDTRCTVHACEWNYALSRSSTESGLDAGIPTAEALGTEGCSRISVIHTVRSACTGAFDHPPASN